MHGVVYLFTLLTVFLAFSAATAQESIVGVWKVTSIETKDVASGAFVFARCPRTDEPVATGFAANLNGLVKLVQSGTPFRCPAWRTRHVLSPHTCWLSL